MTKDNDAEVLRKMGNAITNLQVTYRGLPLEDQAIVLPRLRELMDDYSDYEARLIKDGTITSDEELGEIEKIAAEVSAAATRQTMLIAIARAIAIIAAA